MFGLKYKFFCPLNEYWRFSESEFRLKGLLENHKLAIQREILMSVLNRADFKLFVAFQ